MFYNDKRFKETSRKILEILKGQTRMGVVLALQTENPLSLGAINRINVTEEEIDNAIAWAKGHNLTISTNLIFGMPHDTRDGFVGMLDKAFRRGFDDVIVLNLLLMDGIEMNRPDYREKYNIKTKYRILSTCYGKHNDTFLAEHEEVVVSSNTFKYEDFLAVRYMNFMFYSVFNFAFNKWFFHFVKNLGINPSKFFSHFCHPDRSGNWPERYIRFLDDLRDAIEGELYDTPEELEVAHKKIFEANGNNVGESPRINVNFGGRLTYLERDWIKEVLLRHLDKIMDGKLSNEERNAASLLIDLAERERVDLKKIGKKEPLNISFDVINWKKNKFKGSLFNQKMPEKMIKFSIDKSQASMLEGFQQRFHSYSDQDYYHEALEYIRPFRNLLHNLSYEDRHRTNIID
jgi:hypothetical protein